MARAVFWSQAVGLALRTWHYSKRQRCVNFCNFIVPPLAVVLIAVLNRVLGKDNTVIEPFELRPLGAFAPVPVRPDQCAARAGRARAGGSDALDPAAARRQCAADPFVPKYTVPYYAPAGAEATAALGRQDRSQASSPNNPPATVPGILADISLSPYIYPEAIEGRPFYNSQTAYDGIFMNLTGGRDSPLYKNFSAAQRTPGGLDAAYRTSARQYPDRQSLLSLLYDTWYRDSLFPAYSSAYGFDAISRIQTTNTRNANVYAVNATVFYNSSVTDSHNCTVDCPVVSGVQRLDAAIFAAQSNGTRSANAYLRRMPKTKGVAPSFINLIMSIFLGLFLHFFIPSFIGFLVYERKARLRELMSSMGMTPATYWLSTYVSLLVQYMIKALLLIIVGLLVQSTFFTKNSPVFYVILFFLWGNVVVAHAVLLAPFFSDPATGIVFGWLYVILVNLVGGRYIGQLLQSDKTSNATWLSVMILPSFALLRPVYVAGAFNSFNKGFKVGSTTFKGVELGICRGRIPTCTSYAYLIVQWIVMMILGLYLDQVLPSASSVRRHPLFFLGFKRSEHVKAAAVSKHKKIAKNDSEEPQDIQAPVPFDVAREQEQVREMMNVDPSHMRGVVISNLDKVYPGTKPPVHAVRDLSLSARVNEVTGIIGGNGAGKSTAFRIMTGSIEATAGNVIVDGHSVITDLARVQSAMGVCFQQDILWNSLTIDEHLYFFSRLRAVSKQEIPAVVDAALESVDLTFARKRRAEECSGGMRRRLSVAISLLGNPKCCLLDEPTTGLDPQTRERVWQAINTAKHDKTIILTTHSMEEAQKLCDRIGLMSKGSLKCIGQPEELRLRLGRGYNLSISVPDSSTSALHELVMSISPEAIIEAALAGNVRYSIPRSVPASSIFKAIGANRERLQITDWGLAQSSLEDVFLNVTRDEAAVRDSKHAVDSTGIV